MYSASCYMSSRRAG